MTTIRGHLKRWRIADVPGEARALAAALDVDRFTAALLWRRGLRDPEVARQFLDPRLNNLHDPRLLPGAQQAAARLAQAVKAGEPIVIYGDYDVDGVTASAILYHVLKTAQPDADVRCYVPHRLDEGYGLNTEAITRLIDDGARVIISVDCGITAVEPAATARARGVDLIITDHHEMDEQLPDAYALVHPRIRSQEAGGRRQETGTRRQEPGNRKQETGLDPGSCSLSPVPCSLSPDPCPLTPGPYPFPDLCGAGVAYKVAWQFARTWCGSERVSEQFRQVLVHALSLAALGTVADIVPLVGENRTITVFGLRRVKQTPFAGLNALIDASNLRGEKIDSYHVGFVLGPRLNACGRMGHASEAVKLLTDAQPHEAVAIARMLSKANDDRRATEREIFEMAKAMVRERGMDRDDCRAIVLGHETWHAGVVGIVCSRLVETFGRPTILLSTSNGHAHGSGRSIDGFNLHEALHACGEHLDKFGGHAMAAGLTLATEKIDAFRQALCDYALSKLCVDDLVAVLDIDAEVQLGDLGAAVIEQMQRLAPFGRDNASPQVVVRGARVRQVGCMGAEGRHLSLTVQQGEAVMRCVAWNLGHLKPNLAPGVDVDLAGEPQLNHFNGRTTVELVVRDLRW